MGGAIPSQAGLSSMKRVGELASKQSSSIISASIPESGFPACVPALAFLSDGL